MTDRIKNLPVYVMLVGCLLISFGFNLILYNRVIILQDFIKGINPWMSVEQFDLLKTEIDRLESQKYNITKGE